jgi:hypothetical protein
VSWPVSDWFGVALGLIAIACLLLPASRDPAIRLKEWLDDWDQPEEDE